MARPADWLVGLFVLAGCEAAAPPDEQPTTTTRASAKSSAVASAPPIPSVTASAAVSASASAPAEAALTGFAALVAKYPKTSDWPRGKGVVCRDTTCEETEFCCNGLWRSACMPNGTEEQCKEIDTYCDESSDCPGSERCCLGYRNDDRLAQCVSPSRCATFWDSPGRLMVPAHEICARGGACKDPLKTCIDEPLDETVSGGRCVSEKARVRCGGTECPADKPWCYWDKETKTGECIPRGAWYTEFGVFECDDAADCPGQYCCGTENWSSCGTNECEPALAYAFRLCKTSKDCGNVEGKPGECSPPAGLPGGAGFCGWAD